VLRRAQRRAPQGLMPHPYPPEPTTAAPSHHPKWAFWRRGGGPAGAESGE
jgi:hypothetical protein